MSGVWEVMGSSEGRLVGGKMKMVVKSYGSVLELCVVAFVIIPGTCTY